MTQWVIRIKFNNIGGRLVRKRTRRKKPAIDIHMQHGQWTNAINRGATIEPTLESFNGGSQLGSFDLVHSYCTISG